MQEFKFPELILEETLYTLEQLKNAGHGLAHIALAGRSNVGKSSLINALARRKQLAKVSATPGKTRSVNLYQVKSQNFYLTDLPGYGYARRSKTERALWGNLIEQYLLECESLAAIAILLDCRLDPQEVDVAMVQFALAHHIEIIPILTKADKCTQKERALRQSQWSVLIPRKTPLAVSAHSGLGLEDLWKDLIAMGNNFNHLHHIEQIDEESITQNQEVEEVQEALNLETAPTKQKIRSKRGAVAKEKEKALQAQKLKDKRKAQAERNRQKYQTKK